MTRRGEIIVVDFPYSTVEQRTILHTLGSLSQSAMLQINQCLKSALDLP